MMYKLGLIGWIIVLCLMATIAASIHPELYDYGMHRLFFQYERWGSVVLQFVLFQFLHGGALHLFSNILFLVLIGLGVQYTMGTKRFMLLFLFSTLFIGTIILFTSDRSTIGMSGFAMALLAFYTLMLWSVGDSHYKGGLVLIAINLVIGLDPGISLEGHFLGVVAGALYWLMDKNARQHIYVYRQVKFRS